MSATENPDLEQKSAAPRRRMLVLVPLAAFLALAFLFMLRLGARDPSRIPSALIGHVSPTTNLPPLPGLMHAGKEVPGLNSSEFVGQVTVINVWASWCVPCRDEAPVLMVLAGDRRIRIIGMNYKDQPENALHFLARYGNPFIANGVDPSGRAGIEWEFMACRRASSSVATARSRTNWLVRSRRRIWTTRSNLKSKKR